MRTKEKLYMVCDYTDDRAASINGTPDVGVEFMGNCGGRLLREDGSIVGGHHSSSFGWLRHDLKGKVTNIDDYEVIDLIGQPVPERFQRQGNEENVSTKSV